MLNVKDTFSFGWTAFFINGVVALFPAVESLCVPRVGFKEPGQPQFEASIPEDRRFLAEYIFR